MQSRPPETNPLIEALAFIVCTIGGAIALFAGCYAIMRAAGWLLHQAYATMRWLGLPHSPALVLGVLAVACVVGWGVPKLLQGLGSRKKL